MRNYLNLLFGVTLLLISTASIANEPTQRLDDAANAIYKSIKEKNYAHVESMFSENMLKNVSKEKYEADIFSLINESGEIEKLEKPHSILKYQAVYPAQFVKRKYDIHISLNEKGEIDVLDINAFRPLIPVTEKNVTTLELPFEGQWLIVEGGDTSEQNYHVDLPSQGRAFDIIKVNENGKKYAGDGVDNKDYFSYSQKVLAPASGIISDVVNGIRDNEILGSVNPLSAMGNAVLIRHKENEYSFLAHFKQNSIVVKVGDKVRKGQLLGLVGNSGWSTGPHLHFQLQNTPVMQDATGIKSFFSNVLLTKDGNTQLKERYSPIKGDLVQRSND